MIGAFLGSISGRAALIAALLCLAGLGFWRSLARIDAMVEAARAEARAGRDAHWRGEIVKANAEAEAERARIAFNASVADGVARDEISRLQAALNTMETDNAALPNGAACGLGRDRVRLLNAR